MATAPDQTAPVVRPLSPPDRVEAWLIPDFDTPQVAAMPEALADAAEGLPDAAALAQIVQEAAQAGFAQGQREGFDAGFATGRAEGLAAGQTEINQIQRRFQGWLHHLANPLAELDREVTHQMARLATQMARALIYRELTLKPEQIELVANAAIAALPLAVRHITLLCHPQEVDALQAAIGTGALSLQGKGDIHVQADEAITAGGLRVLSGTAGIQAQVDATLESRWATLCLRTLGELTPGPGDALPDLAEQKPEQEPEQEPGQEAPHPTASDGDINRAGASLQTPPKARPTRKTAPGVAI
jgi:flagellar assembly protein FliH